MQHQCSLCRDDLSDVPAILTRTLECCDCVFCHACLREWTSRISLCPECRAFIDDRRDPDSDGGGWRARVRVPPPFAPYTAALALRSVHELGRVAGDFGMANGVRVAFKVSQPRAKRYLVSLGYGDRAHAAVVEIHGACLEVTIDGGAMRVTVALPTEM